MNTENMIEITGADLKEVAKAVYDLSSPQGLGFIHYENDTLTDQEAKSMVKDDSRIPLSMDYVKGRACKLTVFKIDGKLFIQDQWFDHTKQNLQDLIERISAQCVCSEP